MNLKDTSQGSGLWVLFVFIGLGALAVTFLPQHVVKPRPGPWVLDVPQQAEAIGVKRWAEKGFHFTPLASYRIHARVLHTERYYWDRSAALSPVDWALGWRGMSDSAILDRLSISQDNRWYFYHWRDAPPLSQETITEQSANTHILPATPEIAHQAKRVRRGDVIRAEGYLVSVDGPNEFKWSSSVSRTDTGDGSCEVFWVTSLTIENR